MKRIHRDCFVASDMVEFLVNQGLADDKAQAVSIGKFEVQKYICPRH